MEADMVKANARKRSLHQNQGVSTNNDSFSIPNIQMQDSQTSVETGKDVARIFSEARSAIKKKTKFRKRTEQIDSSDSIDQVRTDKRTEQLDSSDSIDQVRTDKRTEQLDSSDSIDQVRTDKHPQEVGPTNTHKTNIASAPTLSDEGNSEENTDSFNANETSDVVTPHISQSRKKLIVLDLNGLLADILYTPPMNYTPDAHIAGRAIFKRPYCDDFLKFCFDKFEVGIWSSRNRKNVERFIDFLMGDMKRKLLFSWDSSYCTATQFNIPGHKFKPLVFKDLRKVWGKHDPDLPWEKGYYNESNTLLIDDSPHKALLNPPHTAIFPHSFKFDMDDNSLGDGGDLKVYLERLASADNLQNFIEQNPFGQIAITEGSQDWGFYSQVIDTCLHSEIQNNVGLPT